MPLTSKEEILHGASAAGDEKSVEALLDEGVSPNGEDTDGKTALDVAATQRIRDMLIKKGGRPGSKKR